MKISTRGRHAVRFLVEVAVSEKEYVSISEMAEKLGVSLKYLEQIISKLVKAKLLISQRGASGGYKLSKPANEYSITEILSVTGDMPELVPCLRNNVNCDKKNKCTTIGVWETLSKIIYDYLDNVSLQDLIDKTY